MKTKTKKIISLLGVIGLISTGIGMVKAVNIGNITVTGSGTMTQNITWDGNFPVNASGSVSGIKVKAKVAPTLNMSISAHEINLGTLTPGTASGGSIDLEVGTNARQWVLVTATSEKKGLEQTADSSIKINNEHTGESYTFESVAGNSDSSAPSFSVNTVLTKTEINSTNYTNTIYQTNKAEAFDTTSSDFSFKVEATASSETPAGEYEDVITFTITGNF